MKECENCGDDFEGRGALCGQCLEEVMRGAMLTLCPQPRPYEDRRERPRRAGEEMSGLQELAYRAMEDS